MSGSLLKNKSPLPLGLRTLIEIGVMFLPAIPAYLWVWPRVSGAMQWGMQVLAYMYVLGGTWWISLRHWSLRELGFTWQGLGVSLVSGLLIILGRTLIIWSVDWDVLSPPFNGWRILGELVFYFGLVGLVEEGLFRGLVYHALETWKGVRWAIWGSSIGFALWHVFGQGLLVGLAMIFYGLMFALIRWRAGSVIGLIFVHGLLDFTAVQILPTTDVPALMRPEISYPGLLFLGCALLVMIPLYLWLGHPHITRSRVLRSKQEDV